MKEMFNITGMTCSACSSHIEKAIKKLSGINSVNVNLLQNNMYVDFDENIISSEAIISAVEKSGYSASLRNNKNKASSDKPNEAIKKELKDKKLKIILSFIFLIPLFYVSMGSMLGLPLPSIISEDENILIYGLVQMLLTIPVMIINGHYYKNGFKSLFHLSPNMDSLIAIGSSAAFIYSLYSVFSMAYYMGRGDLSNAHSASMNLYFESAAMILTLISVGKLLELHSKGKTSQAITKLIDLAPKTALVLRNGEQISVGIEEVVPGDIVIVKQGASVPVDGTIIEGGAYVDESLITGESMPIEKTVNDKVICASVNKGGFIKIKAEKVGADTTLSQIIRLVEQAASSKAPIAKLADKVSAVFVPAVISIALITAVVWLILGQSAGFSLSVAVAVLVISCPCALGLATPTAIMVGTGKGAENAVLIKSAQSLETAHLINTVVLDKTGTITEGKPFVTDIVTAEDTDKQRLMEFAFSIEKFSEHPLALAVMEYAEQNNIKSIPLKNFKAVAGGGISAETDDGIIFGGNMAFMEKNNIAIEFFKNKINELSNDGKTVLMFAFNKKPLGIIALADKIKPTSVSAVSKFKEMNIDVIMLTGDNKITANAIKNKIGITKVAAELLPSDKENEIKKLQAEGKKVAMIGDGINDAPALARADVGIAIGAGTDIAIESADIVLIKNSLLDAVYAIELSRAVIKNIKQNLFWAFFYNCIGIPLAAGVFYNFFGWLLNPMFAAAAMSLSSFFVVTNALRLKLFKPSFNYEEVNAVYIKNNKKNNKIEEKENYKMKKTIKIEGMMCAHCTGRVEKALNEIEGVKVNVSLEDKAAYVDLLKEVSDEELKNVVAQAGYEVVDIINQ